MLHHMQSGCKMSSRHNLERGVAPRIFKKARFSPGSYFIRFVPTCTTSTKEVESRLHHLLQILIICTNRGNASFTLFICAHKCRKRYQGGSFCGEKWMCQCHACIAPQNMGKFPHPYTINVHE